MPSKKRNSNDRSVKINKAAEEAPAAAADNLNFGNFSLKIACSKSQYKIIKFYFDNLNSDLIIYGLRFSYNRNKASVGGYLNSGRKSIVKKETFLMTAKQAKIRIKNWKVMVKRYREKGYSYPTISRIKKQIVIISNKKKLKS
jgi:hypothetical protein